MDTVVLKFGGSSLADNVKLNIVANKIVDFHKNGNKVVVIVSAQGKKTDSLIKEAYELSKLPSARELDVLLSTGEQVSISKLAILLNELGYNAVSLTGWQAGIITSHVNQNAKIETIVTSRIEQELEENKIVIVAGFQGINKNLDITTLGRGGSDTTAIAIAAALKAKECYIFSDVDGVYTADPKKIETAKKLKTLSYTEMLEIANEGARVLHNRCVEIGEKFNIPIVTKSTFNNKEGSIIQNKIEDNSIKSVVKNDNIIYVNLKQEKYTAKKLNKIYELFIKNEISIMKLWNNSNYKFDINLIIDNKDLFKFQNLLKDDLKRYTSTYTNISKISVIGYGIINNADILNKIWNIIELNNLEIINIDLTELKISILFKEALSDNILEQFHNII